MGVLFFALLAKFWYLQVYHCPTLRDLSEKNRIRTRVLPAPRGTILDRAGRIIADNRPAYRLYLVPEDTPDPEATLSTISRLIEIDPETLENIRKEIADNPPFVPILIHPDLPFPILGRIESEKFWLPGILIEASPTRWYAEGNRAAHLLGYLGEVSPNELKILSERGYRRGDVIGRGGLESAFESFLRGKAGALRLEINAAGREVKKIDEVEPQPGLTLELTLDLELQKTAEKLLDERPNPGAVVALDPRNGEILALASRPTYDPNLFATGVKPDYWKELLNHPDDPLENRVIRGQYPPGSTFKLVTALAGLEENAISPAESLSCGGGLRLGRRTYHCWRKEGHGRVELHKAIVQSCDVYFYRLGMRLGVDRIAKYAQILGLSKKTGIDIPGEKSGLIPSEAWKLNTLGEPWTKGEDLSTAIGQGYVLVTPLQLVSAYAQLAEGGKSFQPHLVRRIKHPDGQVVMEFLPQVRNDYSLPEKTREILRAGFIGVVNEPGGTGGAARLPGITVAGKTGTAQVLTRPDNVKEMKEMKVPEKLRDHAWFVAYAPAENPEIAVVVLVEHGGHGASVSAPIARQILEVYFASRAKNPAALAADRPEISSPAGGGD